MKKLFVSSFAVNILVMILNMGTGVMMARYLGPHGRGELAAATRWFILFAGLSTMGLPIAMIYLGKSFKEKQKELFGAFLVTGGLIGFTALVICEGILFLVMPDQNSRLMMLAQLAMLSLPFAVITDGLIGTLQSLNNFRKVLVLRLLSPVGTLVVLLVLLVSGRMDVFHILLLNLVWGGLTFAVTLYWIFRQLRPSFTRVVENGKNLLQYGLKIYASSLVQVFGGSFDQILLSLTLSSYALGIYTVATSIGGILPSILFGALNVFLFPRLMDLTGENRRREVERMHAVLFHGTLLLSLCGAALLPFLIPFMYGREFTSAVVMGLILLLISPLKIGYSILLSFQGSEGKFKVLSQTEVIGIVSGLGSMFLLVHYFGTVGAVWAIAVSSAAKWLFLAYHSRKLGISIGSLFRFGIRDLQPIVRMIQVRKQRRVELSSK